MGSCFPGNEFAHHLVTIIGNLNWGRERARAVKLSKASYLLGYTTLTDGFVISFSLPARPLVSHHVGDLGSNLSGQANAGLFPTL